MLLWQKMVMLYLAFAIGCSFWQPDLVFNNASPLSLFNMNSSNYNSNNFSLSYSDTEFSSDISPNSAIGNAQRQGNTESGGVTNTTFFLIDALFSIMQFIILLFAIVFSPFVLLSQGALPYQIGLVIGVPMVTLMIIGLMGFIRGTG